MRLLLILAIVVVFLYGLHHMALYAQARGWIYYTIRPPRIKMLGMLEELVDPRVEYLIEEQSSEAIRADQPESGDDHVP